MKVACRYHAAQMPEYWHLVEEAAERGIATNRSAFPRFSIRSVI